MNVNANKLSWKLVVASAALLLPTLALASSHREAPAISRDPAADNTDVYAWIDANNLYIIANYIPFEEPAGGPNFNKLSDDVLYEIHIARGSSSLADAITYQFKTSTAALTVTPDTATTAVPGGGVEFFSQISGYFAQTVAVTKVVGGVSTVITPAGGANVAPPNFGPRSFTVLGVTTPYALNQENVFDGGVATDAYTKTFVTNLTSAGTANEGQVFVGPRDDPFYVDLGGVFDLANLRAKGVAQDGCHGLNVHTIALSIPLANLTETVGTDPNVNVLGIWASASRRKVTILRNNGTNEGDGPWVQVSRLGWPLINEAIIGIQDKDNYNRTQPANDLTNFGSYFLFPTLVRDAVAVGDLTAPQGAAEDGAITETGAPGPGRYDIVDTINSPGTGITTVGDVLRINLAKASQFPNGRSISGGATANQEQVPVTDVILSVVLLGGTSGITQGVDYNDANFTSTFPFLANPWRGFDQGHGVPTP
jgi:hypothetical protein